MDQLTTNVDQLTSNLDQLTTNVDQLTSRLDQQDQAIANLDSRLDQLPQVKYVELTLNIRYNALFYLECDLKFKMYLTKKRNDYKKMFLEDYSSGAAGWDYRKAGPSYCKPCTLNMFEAHLTFAVMRSSISYVIQS